MTLKKCSKCGKTMKYVSILQGSRYPMGHYECSCGFVVSKKSNEK